MSHTPGPWRFNEGKDIGFWPYIQRGRAGGNTVQSAEGRDNALADARLMAAAPELLEAADKALKDYEAMGASEGFVANSLRTAIQKARGHVNG